MSFLDQLVEFSKTTGFYEIFNNFTSGGWKSLIMIALSCFLLWLAIKKKFEPLLLIGIAFGMLLTNLPGAEMYHGETELAANCVLLSTLLCIFTIPVLAFISGRLFA